MYTIPKSNFRPYGRDFINGINGQPTGWFSSRFVTDFLSEGFHLKPAIPAYLDSSYVIVEFATVCFASAGTGYDDATFDVLVNSSKFNLKLHLYFQTGFLQSRVDFMIPFELL